MVRGNPTLGFLDIVHRQGAGMLEIDDAVEADAIVSPSSLALREIESGSATRWLRIDEAEERCDTTVGSAVAITTVTATTTMTDAVTYTLGTSRRSTGANDVRCRRRRQLRHRDVLDRQP